MAAKAKHLGRSEWGGAHRSRRLLSPPSPLSPNFRPSSQPFGVSEETLLVALGLSFGSLAVLLPGQQSLGPFFFFGRSQ